MKAWGRNGSWRLESDAAAGSYGAFAADIRL
jgi:hypothetical protein